jgi:large subunit ribosomal protein L30
MMVEYMADAKKQIKLKLLKSIHGRLSSHKACVLGLGLKKINQTVIVEDTPCNRGMINQVFYLLKVEEL